MSKSAIFYRLGGIQPLKMKYINHLFAKLNNTQGVKDPHILQHEFRFTYVFCDGVKWAGPWRHHLKMALLTYNSNK